MGVPDVHMRVRQQVHHPFAHGLEFDLSRGQGPAFDFQDQLGLGLPADGGHGQFDFVRRVGADPELAGFGPRQASHRRGFPAEMAHGKLDRLAVLSLRLR